MLLLKRTVDDRDEGDSGGLSVSVSHLVEQFQYGSNHPQAGARDNDTATVNLEPFFRGENTTTGNTPTEKLASGDGHGTIHWSELVIVRDTTLYICGTAVDKSLAFHRASCVHFGRGWKPSRPGG